MSHRKAFRAALAEGEECNCQSDECSLSCPLCTALSIPCPVMYPSIYYADGAKQVRIGDQVTLLTWAVIRYGQCACLDDCTGDCALCAAVTGMLCPHGRHVVLRAHALAMRQGYESGELPCPHEGTTGSGNCTTADGRWYHGDCAPPEQRNEPTEATAIAEDPPGRFRVGHHTGLTVWDDLKRGEKTGKLIAVAQSRDVADQIAQALNVVADPDAMVRLLVDSGLTGVEIAARTQKARQDTTFVCSHHGTHPHDGLTCARCPVCLETDPNARNAAHDYSDVIRANEEVRDAAGER